MRIVTLREIAAELEDSFGNGSREEQNCIGAANHDAKPILSAGLSVASPWFIRGEFR